VSERQADYVEYVARMLHPLGTDPAHWTARLLR
jgi:hypothetical protein